MTIKWLGHSCFLLTDSEGTRLLLDPCDPATGYDIGVHEVDAVTSSHGHHDHNYFAAAGENPRIINEPGEYTVNGVKITGYPTWHDDAQGALRGRNIMYLFEMDGLRVLHAGDLGQLPDEDTINSICHVDVLLVPVGGVYTIDHRGARELANTLGIKVLIPMHYKTDAVDCELEEVTPLLDHARGCAIHRMRQSEASISPESLGNDRIIVLDYRA